MKHNRKKYLQQLNPLELLKTKKVLQSNPTVIPSNDSSKESEITLYSYTKTDCKIQKQNDIESVLKNISEPNQNYWLNLDIVNKNTIDLLAEKLDLHVLLVEDILSKQQRPKVDDIYGCLSIVVQMLYYNDEQQSIEGEQVSFILKNNLLISIQDDAARDLFNPIRDRLKLNGTKLKESGVDYLLYSLMDAIVDHYFIVLEKLGHQIEKMEEEVTQNIIDDYAMNQLNNLRKELIWFRRNTFPVRELLNSILRLDGIYISDNIKKYYKDVYDNSLHVNDLTDNYRDVLTNIRDLNLSQANMKMNEVMKFLAIVTTLLAPATVIGGIFGMNFDRIPYLHHQYGFWIASVFMISIPLIMLYYFRKKGWF